ncbi:hypothetical protein LD11_gp269 [Bacillus phage Riley]|uniref:Uncharacterized protein n=3 Tax=Bequatrovirus TaxID=1917990 RepID=A0A075M0N5_9CAUD|nr:hypothetical protein LD11_gp269 [Bacillus phage Riley]YP_009206633.1 hypothetical protein AVV02_gp278 [Bacillus phage AvesoBmore]ASZ76002.1 hypothetical protein TAFFO16_269 [Bacillus phage Taffo16]ULF48895.1 hypothetical protein [Bacillus phage BillyBob]AIF72145.1 hypothetical protein [Bacillus phage Riley]ALA13264.1 hypothetical protein AVESOBMORE_278 [Bacillus phage AvesoBmore]
MALSKRERMQEMERELRNLQIVKDKLIEKYVNELGVSEEKALEMWQVMYDITKKVWSEED